MKEIIRNVGAIFGSSKARIFMFLVLVLVIVAAVIGGVMYYKKQQENQAFSNISLSAAPASNLEPVILQMSMSLFSKSRILKSAAGEAGRQARSNHYPIDFQGNISTLKVIVKDHCPISKVVHLYKPAPEVVI